MDIKTNSRDDVRKAIKKSGGGAESIINLNIMAKKALSEEHDCD